MAAQPNITISSRDASRLERLLESPAGRVFPGRAALQIELDRADIVEPEAVPPTLVTMNSTVHFSISGGQAEGFRLTLVYPKDVTTDGSTISVLAPVGSALLGLSQGDRMEWPKPGGGTFDVCIEGIDYQPESAGDLHR